VRLKKVRSVFLKELKETVRDRRTLVMMVVVPVLLYPLLLVAAEQFALFGQKQIESRSVVIAVSDDPPGFRSYLAQYEDMTVLAGGEDERSLLEDRRIDAWIRFDTEAMDGRHHVEVVFNPVADRSRFAETMVAQRIDSWSDSLLVRQLESLNLTREDLTPVVRSSASIATAQDVGGYALGRFLPIVLIMMALLGAFYPAIDLSAGEKERGTLEALLASPATAGEFVAGKFAAVATIGFAAASLNLFSMLVTFQSGIFKLSQTGLIDFSVPLWSIFVILSVLLLLVVFFSAILLGISVRSHSFKEAQNSLTPIQMGLVFPAFIASVPGIDFSSLIAVLPVVGVAFLFRELLVGSVGYDQILLVTAATALYAGLALLFASRSFGRESILFGVGSASLSRPKFSGLGSFLAKPYVFIMLVALLQFAFGSVLQIKLGEVGVFASQWMLLAVPAFLYVAWKPYGLSRSLAFRPASIRNFVAGILIIIGGMPVGVLIGWIQAQFLPIPEEFVSYFAQMLQDLDPFRIAWLFFLIAVTPAICEELVFRGALQQSLSNRLRPWQLILIPALIFGAFHVPGGSIIRFLPTFWIGLLIGYVVWKTSSLYVGMLMHFINNGLILLMLILFADSVTDVGVLPSPVFFVAGIMSMALGFRLLKQDDSLVEMAS
jgi:sodium transport system permease protein